MIWKKPKNHSNDSCSCKIQGHNKKIDYPNFYSVIRPVQNGSDLLVPTPPVNLDYVKIHSEEENSADKGKFIPI